MSKTTYLVVRASRGIGRAIVEQLSNDTSNHVLATTRETTEFGKPNVENLILEQTDSETIDAAAATVKELDVLIVNAAIGDLEYLLSTSVERLQQYVETNLVDVHCVVNAFVPALRAGTAKKIIIISSTSGSNTVQKDASHGLQGPYSVTKTANNMQAMQYHNKLHKDGFTVIALHPGWVASDMGNVVNAGKVKPMPVTMSANNISQVVQAVKYEELGTFFSHDGSTLPWQILIVAKQLCFASFLLKTSTDLYFFQCRQIFGTFINQPPRS